MSGDDGRMAREEAAAPKARHFGARGGRVSKDVAKRSSQGSSVLKTVEFRSKENLGLIDPVGIIDSGDFAIFNKTSLHYRKVRSTCRFVLLCAVSRTLPPRVLSKNVQRVLTVLLETHRLRNRWGRER